MSRNTAEPDKIAHIDEWRRKGREYLAKHCPNVSFGQFRAKAISILRNEVTTCYLNCLNLSHLNRTPSQLGRRYLVNAGTINKWTNKHDSTPQEVDQLKDMTFSRACVIAAAEDVMFPRGLYAAVTGTRKIFEFVARELGFNDAATIDNETVLWLYFIVRSEEWERVQRQKAKGLSKREYVRAAQSIWTNVLAWFPLARSKDPSEIQTLSGYGRLRTQAVLEAVINHDWFSDGEDCSSNSGDQQ